MAMRVLVGCKRVIDYAVKVLIASCTLLILLWFVHTYSTCVLINFV